MCNKSKSRKIKQCFSGCEIEQKTNYETEVATNHKHMNQQEVEHKRRGADSE
jgi:hypothetical protein